MIKYIFCSLLILCFSTSLYARKLLLTELEAAMLRSNPDIQILRLKEKFAQEQIVQARSGHFPSLSSSWVANEGVGNDPVSATGVNGTSSFGSGTPTPSASNAGGSAQSVSQDGWSADLTLAYPIFNKFLVSTSLANSKRSHKKNSLGLDSGLKEKKVQLLQLILEINALKSIRKTIREAQTLSRSIKKGKGRRTSALYSADENLKVDEFSSDLNYQSEKTALAWNLAVTAFEDLIPESDPSWIKKLPQLNIHYTPGNIYQIKDKFEQENLKLKMSQLDVDNFQEIHSQTQWERPWIPQIFLNASLSRSRDWKGTLEGDESKSVSLLFSFKIFDGFYTESRRAQAYLSHRISQEAQKSEKSKLFLSLKRHYQESKLAKAKHQFLLTKVKRARKKNKVL